MEDIDERYSRAMMGLYEGIEEAQDEDEYDPNDPFWAAMERGLERNKLKYASKSS